MATTERSGLTGLKHACKECGTPLGFEGLCWKCRARHHREEINGWSEQEIERKKVEVIEKLKGSEEDEFYKTDECDIFRDLMTRGIDCNEISRAACEEEIYYNTSVNFHRKIKR